MRYTIISSRLITRLSVTAAPAEATSPRAPNIDARLINTLDGGLAVRKSRDANRRLRNITWKAYLLVTVSVDKRKSTR